MTSGQVFHARLRHALSASVPSLSSLLCRLKALRIVLTERKRLRRVVLLLLLAQWCPIALWTSLHMHAHAAGVVIPVRSIWEFALAAMTFLPVLCWCVLTGGQREEHEARPLRQTAAVDGLWSGHASWPMEGIPDSLAASREQILSGRLREAIQQARIRVVYQPLFAVDGSLTAMEALARWTDHDEGEISPAEFIPIAEAHGLISQLSTAVMVQACQQMQLWRTARFPIGRVTVNVSVVQICRGDFFPSVLRVLHETKLEPGCLELEVTESAFARDLGMVRQTLQALRRLGVRISIDDFGVGYSSLSRLRDLDVDVLKVDKIFVQSAADTANGLAVVQAIIEMAHTLKLSVVAEGVETPRQMDLLRSMRCDEIQGFLLSRPLSAEMLLPLLLSEKARNGEISDSIHLELLHA